MNRDRTLSDPQLRFGDNGTPWSEMFSDTYFDTQNGLEESRQVFLQGCDLPESWRGKHSFVIGETGFGTGLNFLAVWHAWRQSALAGC